MQLLRGWPALEARTARDWQGAVLAIGGFDGVHLGHQTLLRAARRKADELGAPTMVMSFEPSPREYFMRAAAPARLQRFRDKYAALARAGIDYFACLRFDARIAAMPAEEFVERVLHDTLRLRWLVVGPDFRFGHGRAGAVADLLRWGPPLGFGVQTMPPFCLAGERVSSTLVRQSLAQGDLQRAEQLLGRPYTIAGRVVRGQQLGRTLQFPTANLRLLRRVIPLFGVFAVRVSGAGLAAAPAVASLGTRPVVQGTEPLLEVHVFDYQGDLYGQHLEVEFIARLRDELMFPSLDALVVQMHADAAEARRLLRD